MTLGGTFLYNSNYITVVSNRKKAIINISTILYVIMTGKIAEIHLFNGKIYKTRMTFSNLEKELEYCFIKAHRGCLVSVMAIHNITDYINLSNDEALIYTRRKKNEIINQFRIKQKDIINSFDNNGIPKTYEEYRKHYISFENMPFAFTDIEMIFNEENHAVDWIFKYGNSALAKLEKIPLEQLIGSSFRSLFDNIDSKWFKSYERATIYGEILEIIDYSPEIDTHLKVICFPTFKGHCGCILFNISEIEFTQNSGDAEKNLMLYLSNTIHNKNNKNY